MDTRSRQYKQVVTVTHAVVAEQAQGSDDREYDMFIMKFFTQQSNVILVITTVFLGATAPLGLASVTRQV